jgi:hypothetical protein
LRTSTAPPEPITAIARCLLAEHGFPGSAHHDRAVHVAFGTTQRTSCSGPSAPDPVITERATAGGSKARLSQLLAQWDTASSDLQGSLRTRVGPRLGCVFQLRYGVATSTPRRQRFGHSRTRTASLPSLFWREWALRLNPQSLFDPLPYRQALSVLLQIAGLGDIDYAAARSLLGLPSASNAVCSHFTKKLRQAGAWEPVLATLSQLARALDDHPAPSTTDVAVAGDGSRPPPWMAQPGGPHAHRSAIARPNVRNGSRDCA